MAAAEPTGEDGHIEAPSMLMSNAFGALSALFDECVRDVWTPLSGEQCHLLAQQFDASMKQVAKELDANSFCICECLPFLLLVFNEAARSVILCFLSPVFNKVPLSVGNQFSMNIGSFPKI